jgi:hypothetical protein
MKAYEKPAVTLVGGFRTLTKGLCGCHWEWLGCGWD